MNRSAEHRLGALAARVGRLAERMLSAPIARFLLRLQALDRSPPWTTSSSDYGGQSALKPFSPS